VLGAPTAPPRLTALGLERQPLLARRACAAAVHHVGRALAENADAESKDGADVDENWINDSSSDSPRLASRRLASPRLASPHLASPRLANRCRLAHRHRHRRAAPGPERPPSISARSQLNLHHLLQPPTSRHLLAISPPTAPPGLTSGLRERAVTLGSGLSYARVRVKSQG